MRGKIFAPSLALLLSFALCLLTGRAHAAWTEHVLYNFCTEQNCSDGEHPIARLLMDPSGNLYGTTPEGGSKGYGTVFELFPNSTHTRWTLQTLHNFCLLAGCKDGAQPSSALIIDRAGNLYGLTGNGGRAISSGSTYGVIYRLSPPAPGSTKWTFKVLHVFCAQGGSACQDGNNYGALQFGQSGLAYKGATTGAPYDGVSPLYGATPAGGAGGATGPGVIFQLTPGATSWTEKIIHSFCSVANGSTCPNDGSGPFGQVVMDASGNLFGTTFEGGAGLRDSHGQGTVFELIPNQKGTQWTERLLYSFCSGSSSCADGANPTSEPVLDTAGNIFGTTGWGGFFPCYGDPNGCGSVFKLSPGLTETTLYAFCPTTGCADGFNPGQGVMIDSTGRMFGTTPQGGNASSSGSIFELSSSGFQLVHAGCSEPGCTDGGSPRGGVITDGKGRLYGMQTAGGAHNGGVVYSITP